MRRTRTYRKRYPYDKRLRDAIAGWRGGVEALVRVSQMMEGRRWLLAGGHAVSCYTTSRLCAEIVVVVEEEVELLRELEVGDPFPVTTRVIVRSDIDGLYRRGVDHHLRGRCIRIPCRTDLLMLLKDGDYRDWADLGRLLSSS